MRWNRVTNRQRQAVMTKQRILDTAEQLIREKGFDKVSVDDIVAACGVAKGTFYHYFRSKDEILVYITRTPYEELKRKFAETEGRPALERLKQFILNWYDMADRFAFHFSVSSFRAFQNAEKIDEYSRNDSQMEYGILIIRECLKDAISNEELQPDAPAEALAHEIMFSMQGSILYRCRHPENFHSLDWESCFSRMILKLLLGPYIVHPKMLEVSE